MPGLRFCLQSNVTGPASLRPGVDRMAPTTKSKAAKYGLVVSILGFVSGGMLLCDCPGWFVCAGVAALLPAIWGARVWRIAGICLCIASFAAAVVQFRHEREQDARTQQILEKARNTQPEQ